MHCNLSRAVSLGVSLFLVALCAPSTVAQDTIAAGFAATTAQPVPVPFAAYATRTNGERVVFDGQSIDLYDADNQLLLHLGDVPGFVFASFVALDPTDSYALVGENSTGDIFRVELDGSGMTTVANLPFNFDCVFEDAAHALVSAATCGFGCGNDIARVEAVGGGSAFVANVPGPSGPLAMHPDGRLFYATQSDMFPAPPGSTDIVSWTPAQLASGNLLGLGDAALFRAGLDGGASMAIDPVFGNVFVAESIFGATSEILEFDGNGALVGAVVSSLDYLGSLELLEGPGTGHFHAWQPGDGVFLHYGNGTDVRTVRPRRPRGQILQFGPVVEFRVTGAVPNGAFLLMWGAQSTYDPNESAHGIFNDFLFVTGMPLNGIRRQPFLFPTDANGASSFTFFDPGGLAGTLVFQGLITDISGTEFLGTTTAALH